jgi:hypothetical protein
MLFEKVGERVGFNLEKARRSFVSSRMTLKKLPTVGTKILIVYSRRL